MQNTPQTFRGAGAPGVNFADHNTYDNHVGAHCPPSGYQPYPNQPYHPSPRPHHYANHQMQQNMPYRHHGGAYAPNQNQYGSNMNQDMYRNHSGYAGVNNRNMSSKPWTENNPPAEMMPHYGQVSHPQMMNNPPPQMPVSTMRSPPHATSNMNPAPPQGQQHYRQMQSPAHSPHSWSQAQIPSPGMIHSSRTTPSPLQTHVRSPGHSQPFSPPAAHSMNIQSHSQPPPENGPQPLNAAGGSDTQNPSNPLHSLQKMVMLDQDSNAMLPMIGDNNEQYANHCGPQNYVPDESANNEAKDSVYSTYYNLDENCLKSEASGSNDNSYSNVQQVSNCNYPVPPHIINAEKVQSNAVLPNNSSNVPDCLTPDQSSLLSEGNNPVTSVAHSQNNAVVAQNNCVVSNTECPPHAESAPMFTDQTTAAVSTNSEQALESKSDLMVQSDVDDGKTSGFNVENQDSSISGEKVYTDAAELENSVNDSQNQNEGTTCGVANNSNDSQPNSKSNVQKDSDSQSRLGYSSGETDLSPGSDQLHKDVIKVECDREVIGTSAACQNSSIIKVSAEVHKSDTEEIKFDSINVNNMVVKEELADEGIAKNALRTQKTGASYEGPSPEIDLKNDENIDIKTVKESIGSSDKCDNPPNSLSQIKEPDRNPVKVVIHRIRKDDTSDTWHVPNANSSDSYVNASRSSSEKKPEQKVPNVGPQIVILSPATSDRKFGFRSSVDENSVITIKEEDDESCVIIENNRPSFNIKRESGSSSLSRSPDKKRGRPVGSKNRIKPGCSVKRKRGKKGKKKKFENSKQKVLEAVPKIKKISKLFNGPYVHITGSKENPSSISVVNVAQKEEEKISKIPVKRNFNNTVSRIKKKQVGHLSTLSPTYDAFNRDKTWLCIFCHKGSHHGGLGDLYGPYYIKDKNYNSTKSSTSSGAGSVRTKKRKSDHDDGRASKRCKQTAGHSANESTPVIKNSENALDPDSDLRETWIHEDCAVWCQSISLMGEEVQGLEEAVTDAYENTCCQCSLTGATLGCWGKCCKELYHYSCAKETGCQMDIENFSLLCPKHQKRSPDRRNRCQ